MKASYRLLTIALCLLSEVLLAQNGGFKRIDNIPVSQNGMQLKNPWAGGLNYPLFSQIDLNGDGIKDLFTFDISNGRIECFINGGMPDSVNYQFSSAYFKNFPYLHDWVFLRDYNCDSLEDIFAFSDDLTGIKVYKNISSGGNLLFTLVSSDLTTSQDSVVQAIPIGSQSYPAFIDVDNDGDLDILNLTNGQPRTVVYNKNISEENGWGCDSLVFNYETSCWGNFMFAIGPNQVCDTCWHCPNGVHSDKYKFDYNPADAARRDDSLTNIFAFDNNGDGVKDLLIGDSGNSNTLYIQNGGTPASANMVSQDYNFPNYDVPINLLNFTNQAYLDVNNDNKKDLIVSSTSLSNINNVLFYKNTNNTSSPIFSYQENSFLQDGMIDVGAGSYPVFFDYDGDGKQDLIIGNNGYTPSLDGVNVALSLYRNIGSDTSPSFDLVTTDFANISSLGFTGSIYPSFGDMDGDGDADMILGTGDGKLEYFTNAALSEQPADFVFTNGGNYFNIDVGNNATPQIIDLDRDGLLDLVIGKKDGYVVFYRNIGTKSAPIFSDSAKIDSLGKVNTFISVNAPGYSVPFIYDSAGHYNMFLAGQGGYVVEYGNIDGNLNGTFTLIDTIINRSEGEQLSVAGADLNHDGLMDLVVGNYAGGAGIFSRYLPLPVQVLPEIKPSFEIFPNPASNLLTVHLLNLKETDAKLYIVDMLGRNVKNTSVNSSIVNMDVSSLAAGLYLIELQSSRYLETKKLIVRH